MTNSARKPLRLWPGVVIVVLQLLLLFAVPLVVPDTLLYGVLGGVVAAFAVVLWWVFFSRAAWSERLGAVGLIVVAIFATKRIVDVSIATGAQGILYYILVLPLLGPVFVAWAVATRRLPDRLRRVSMAATILLACGGWALVRTGGFTADLHHDLHWRWAKTPEERLLEQSGNVPGALPPVQTAAAAPEKLPVAQPEPEPAAPSAVPAPEKRLVARSGSA